MVGKFILPAAVAIVRPVAKRIPVVGVVSAGRLTKLQTYCRIVAEIVLQFRISDEKVKILILSHRAVAKW